MNQTDEYPLEVKHLQQGLTVLKKRQRNLKLLALATSTVGMVSLVSVFTQQDIVWGLFGLTQNIQQMHIPYAVDAQLREFIHQPDYFFNALAWLGWLILKVIVSFIGAFIVVGILKKFKYFLVRLQSFILKFVAWLLAFIILWSAMTYLQYDLKNDEENEISSFIHYDQGIQQSQIYGYLQKTDPPEPVKHYLLAQTALLHRPIDQTIGKVYVAKLMNDENTDPHFQEYGFKAEQIWALQQQLYAQALSPIAKQVEPKISQARFWSNLIQNILWVMTAICLVMGALIYLLAHRIKQRLLRIDQHIH